jgi:hypothetical protein
MWRMGERTEQKRVGKEFNQLEQNLHKLVKKLYNYYSSSRTW